MFFLNTQEMDKTFVMSTPLTKKNRGMVAASLSPIGSHSAFGASAAPTLGERRRLRL